MAFRVTVVGTPSWSSSFDVTPSMSPAGALPARVLTIDVYTYWCTQCFGPLNSSIKLGGPGGGQWHAYCKHEQAVRQFVTLDMDAAFKQSAL